ncbi:tetratricopeptide repeat protein [Sphingomonas quercus]|uniref:Cytochrome C biogenesis protein n=1 Tax=Sphingomonas quercus TaxID=2842451 RepID=A0ABS6BNS9_9SPHN|nr:tetratricopeptide repeat protein [Sphingomonas quercus]MBU3078909.1 cytochrome C biogenesis protein [Sphingomonas quercus]
MTGWVILVVLAVAVAVALIRFGRLSGSARELALAALLLGIAGYAWQGSPGEPGQPTRPRDIGMQPDSAFAQQRGALLQRFGTSAQWLDFADALHRMGRDRESVIAIKSGLKERPRDANLWVGLGNALVLAGDGMVSPAARLAFERAAQLAPDHPGPPYFLALSYAQSGQVDQALEIWRALLARTPPTVAWRAEIEKRIAEAEAQLQR